MDGAHSLLTVPLPHHVDVGKVSFGVEYVWHFHLEKLKAALAVIFHNFFVSVEICRNFESYLLNYTFPM